MSGRYPPSFGLAVAANLLFFCSSQWTYVTLPAFVQSLGGGATLIGLAYGLPTLSAVATRPAIGRLVDRWGRKPMLVAGAALFCLCPVLCAMVRSVWPLMAIRLLVGVGMAAFTTAYTALVGDVAPAQRRGEAIGLSGVTNNLGLLFAPSLGAYLAARWGYASHFLAAAVPAAASLALLQLVAASPVGAGNRPPVGAGDRPRRRLLAVGQRAWLRRMAGHRQVGAAAVGGAGLAVAYGAALGFVPPFAAEKALTEAGSYFRVFALAMMFAQASAGWIADRAGRRAVAIPGMGLVALAMAGLALTRSNAALSASGAALGLSWGLVRAGLDTSVVDAVPPQSLGTALGFVYTCFDLGIGAGAFGLGVVAQAQSYAAAFWVAAAVAVVALAGYMAWATTRGAPTGDHQGRPYGDGSRLTL